MTTDDDGMNGFLGRVTEFLEKAPSLIDRGQAATVLTTVAYLEDVLQGSLEQTMRPLSNKMRSRLFEGYGPLSTLAARTDLVFALRLVDESDYADLNVIRNVRNKFAHSRDVTRFEDPEIITIVAKMKAPVTPEETEYRIYFARVFEIIRALLKMPPNEADGD